MKLELKKEIGTWTDKITGEIREFTSYFVEVPAGALGNIKVQLKPNDNTGRELLAQIL